MEQLKKEYQYVPNTEALEELLQKGETDRTLFTVNGQTYTGEMFKWFASSHPQAVKRQLNGFIAKSLLDYENRHVEKKHPELRYTLQEYAEKCLVAAVSYTHLNMECGDSTSVDWRLLEQRCGELWSTEGNGRRTQIPEETKIIQDY